MRLPKRPAPDRLHQVFAEQDARRDLLQLAEGQQTSLNPALARFVACPDWQIASSLLLAALHASLIDRRRARLAAPPGWLHPL